MKLRLTVAALLSLGTSYAATVAAPAAAPAIAAPAAATMPAVSAPAAQPTTISAFQNSDQKVSYSIGLEIGMNLKHGFASQSVIVDPTLFAKGVEDALAGNKPALTAQEVQASLAQFQANMLQKAQTNARQAISTNHDALVNAASTPVVGNPKAATSLIEFFDYQCVHCREMAPIILQLQKEDPNLRIVYKEFPIVGESSVLASTAALAAVKQGKYEAFHNALMASTKKLDKDEIMALAKQVGIDPIQLQKDMNDPAIAAEIKANRNLAQALNLAGTPGFIITTTAVVPGKTDQLSVLIPGATNLANLQNSVKTVQNAVSDQSAQISFPANEKDPKQASGTWEGI